MTTNRTIIMLGVIALALCNWAQAEEPRYRVTVLLESSADFTLAMAVNRSGASAGYLLDYSNDRSHTHAMAGTATGVHQIEVPTEFNSMAFAINDSGVVAGSFDTSDMYNPAQHLFTYSEGGALLDHGTLGGWGGEVYDMNNRGDIVGYWVNAKDQFRAFRFNAQQGWTELTGVGDQTTWAEDVNELGDIVGNTWAAGQPQRAWIWRDGVATDLGTLGGTVTNAYYVNNHGVVIGQADGADFEARAFRWTPETGMVALPLLEGAISSKAVWVTDSGVIGGSQQKEDGNWAFIYSDELGLVDIGLNIGLDWHAPVSMNEAGEAVYRAITPHGYDVLPYVYSPEFGLREINSMLEGDWPFVVDEPTDINACGEITAIAWGPTAVSVLLSPIREADLDGDTDVDLADFARLQARLHKAVTPEMSHGDLDNDHDFDADDVVAFIEAWRTPCR